MRCFNDKKPAHPAGFFTLSFPRQNKMPKQYTMSLKQGAIMHLAIYLTALVSLIAWLVVRIIDRLDH